MLVGLQSAYRPGESWTTLVLLDDQNDAAYTQSGITNVTVAVYDLSSVTPTTDLFVGTQPSPSNFYDTLQTGSGWDLPDGFNFKHIIAPIDVSGAINGGHTFQLVYTVETQLDGVRIIPREIVVVS